MATLHSLTLTGPDEDNIARIVHTLIDERLIASANIIPQVRSVYRWEGEIRDTGEALALLQTTEHRVHEVIARVAQLHPYRTPRVLSAPIAHASAEYSTWVANQTALFR